MLYAHLIQNLDFMELVTPVFGLVSASNAVLNTPTATVMAMSWLFTWSKQGVVPDVLLYVESSHGGSAKYLSIVTLHSLCEKTLASHVLQAVAHCESRREDESSRDALDGLTRVSLPRASPQPQRFATANCFVALPLNWAYFKRNEKMVPWRDSVNAVSAEQILLKERKSSLCHC